MMSSRGKNPVGRVRAVASAAVVTAMAAAAVLPGGFVAIAQAQLVVDLASKPGATEESALRETALRAGSVHVELKPADGDGFVPVRFLPAGDPALQLNAPAQGWDWSGAREIRMHLQNAMAWPVTVQLRLTDASGGTLDATLGLPPGGPLTLTLPLQATQPRRWGMVAGPPVPWLQDGAPVAVALTTTGEVDRSRIAALRIGMPKPAARQTLRIGKIFIEPDAGTEGDQERLAYTGIVDAYGQYRRGQWPEKYASGGRGFAEFSRAQEPKAQVSQPATASGVDSDGLRFDAYGGLAGMAVDAIADPPGSATDRLPATTTKGFFRTARIRDAAGRSRWVLVTPQGNAFFSLGVNAIQLDNSQTFVEGREFMFTDLPQPADPLSRFMGSQDSADDLPLDAGAQRGRGYGKGRTFDFYRANLYRRDGEDFAGQWLARTRDRLRQWGFNTIGSWSDLAVSQGARIPYTHTIHVSGDFSRLSDGNNWWAGIADTFDPRFSRALEEAIAAPAESLRADPFLIGYFIDNELGWGNGAATDPRVRYALAYSALGGDAGQPHAYAKRALLEQLRSRYAGSIENLSAEWQQTYSSWADLAPALSGQRLPDGRIPAVAADLSAFMALHAERYFEQVATTLKRHDPNHLYLGARFASRNPEALSACAKWCDVVSFNLYLPSVDVGFETAAFRRLDKPAMLTEFHFGSSDRGPFWNGVMPVAAEGERGPAYDRMLKSVLANPDFVGAHWFQYLDQPVTGRWLDGENGHLGLVAITDIPWGDFVSQVSRSNRQTQDLLRALVKARP